VIAESLDLPLTHASPSHAEGERITAEIRRTLHETGKVGDGVRRFQVLEAAGLTEAERDGAALLEAPRTATMIETLSAKS
jgi:hypothetical protein